MLAVGPGIARNFASERTRASSVTYCQQTEDRHVIVSVCRCQIHVSCRWFLRIADVANGNAQRVQTSRQNHHTC